MKKIIALLITTILMVSCDNNDDASEPTSNDGFTYNNTFYETTNAYFEIDEENNPRKNYTFFFTDGRMFDNDANVNGVTNDFLLSTNTTKLVFLNVLVSDNPNLANNTLPTAGNTYIVSSVEDSVIAHNLQVNSLSTPYLNNGIEFGTGDENIGTFHRPGAVVPTITINAINIDNSNPANSTINADYRFMNTDGEIITGHYEGTFGIMLD